jgi:hypothetical protein
MSYLLGVTTVTSLWFFLHFSGSPIELFGALDQRLLQINYAKTFLPTIILGAIIPALTVTACPEAESSKNLKVIWPILPFFLVILHRLFARLVQDSTPFDRFYRVKANIPSIRHAVTSAAFVTMVLFQYLRFTGTVPIASPLQDIPGVLGGILGSELGGSFGWCFCSRI